MADIKKLSIGIRSATRMFRVTSLSGQIIDALLDARGKGILSNEYFSEVNNNSQGVVILTNEALGNSFHLDGDSVIVTKDVYETGSKIDQKQFINEFVLIWDIINPILAMHSVRRIGIVAEHQIEIKNGSKTLTDSLTTFSKHQHVGRFNLSFEDRRQTKEGAAPDIKKSDFVNVISNFYSSDMDGDHPYNDSINANIDVQRYYSPLLKSKIPEETKKLHKMFISELKLFYKLLDEKGLVSE